MSKDKGKSPEKQAKKDDKKNTIDAFCTECHTWYNSSNHSEVNKHAH